jgi:O-antigen/teichoic acid export membrane protein
VLARLSALAKNLAIYGLGDVATNIVNFLLLPLYTRVLSPAEYGVISLLLTIEVIAKILFRWGVDASFMRLYYDCETEEDRQRLASTIFWFLAALNGAILALLLAAAPFVASHLFGVPGYVLALVLQLVNTFVVGFYFLPFHVLRIEGRSTKFSTLTTMRSAATVIVKLALIVGLRLGVLGFVLADVIVTAVFTVILARRFLPLLRPMFSRALLAEALRFGLPRLPHGVAQQIMAVGDRYILRVFGTLSDVGLYSVGANFGLALKLFLSAFEYAWAPFYFETMKQPDAKQTFRLVTTYGIGVLVLLEAGLAAIASDIVRLMTTSRFHGAAVVIPWIGLGVVFQGVYLLTSIGLNITKSTKYYPVATAIAAGTSIAANMVLVPMYGALGAAWANAIAYVVLAAVAMWLSQRVYPIGYEYGRLLRIAIAGIGAYVVAWLIPGTMPAWLGLLVRGTTVCAAYPLLLVALGFYDRREMAFVARLAAKVRAKTSPPAAPHEEPVAAAGALIDVPLTPEEDAPTADVPETSVAPRSSREPARDDAADTPMPEAGRAPRDTLARPVTDAGDAATPHEHDSAERSEWDRSVAGTRSAPGEPRTVTKR